MPLEERRTFQVGGVVYPLNVGSNDLIVSGDPVIYNILQFYKSILTTYIGEAFAIQATKANLLDAKDQLITLPVVQLVPYNPANFLEEVQFKFPLLSAHRRYETYKELTREWFEVTSELQMLWMLPPLTAQQMYHLDMFRVNVRSVILDRLELGYDPDYNDGELVFQTAGIQAIKHVSTQFLDLENPKNTKTFFPSILMTFEVKERKNQVPGSFPDLTTIDGSLKISDGYEPNDYNMIDFQLDVEGNE